MDTVYGIFRTVAGGVAGGLVFVLGTFVTFAQLGGSRRGARGLLFDPATQHPKVIAVWKEIEPLPRVIESPLVILIGLVVFGIGFAFVYRSVSPAWPDGLGRRAVRLGLIVWLTTVFAEFMGPFNVLHQPLYLSVLAWALWAVCAFAEALTLVLVLDRGRSPGGAAHVRQGGGGAAVQHQRPGQ